MRVGGGEGGAVNRKIRRGGVGGDCLGVALPLVGAARRR